MWSRIASKRRRRAVRRRREERGPADVHRRVLGLDREEGGVERRQPRGAHGAAGFVERGRTVVLRRPARQRFAHARAARRRDPPAGLRRRACAYALAPAWPAFHATAARPDPAPRADEREGAARARGGARRPPARGLERLTDAQLRAFTALLATPSAASPRRSSPPSRSRSRSSRGWCAGRSARSCSGSAGAVGTAGAGVSSPLDTRRRDPQARAARGVRAEELDYLRHVDPQDVRDLREQVTVVMFDADRQMLQRVAAATKLIPSKLAAVVGERAFGSLLCARLTGLLEPSRAVDIAAKLPTPFLADLAVALDPRRASRVIAEIPPEQIAEITRCSPSARSTSRWAASSAICPRPRCAPRSRSSTTRRCCAPRTSSSPRAASARSSRRCPTSGWSRSSRRPTQAGLWIQALDVLRYVDERQRGELGDIAAGQDDEVLDGMVKAAQKELLWDDVLPVTRAMSDESRARFAALKSIQTRPVLASIVDAASRHGLWPELLQLLPLLPAAARRRVAALGTGFGRPVLEQIVGAAHEQGLWGPLLQFGTELERRTQLELAKLLAAVDGRRPRRAARRRLGGAPGARARAASPRCCPPRPWRAFGDRLVERGGEEFVAALREAADGARPRRARARRCRGVSPGWRMGTRPRVSSSTWRRPPRSSPPYDAYGPVGRSEWHGHRLAAAPALGPVEGRWMNLVDIGEGPVILMIHGLSGCGRTGWRTSRSSPATTASSPSTCRASASPRCRARTSRSPATPTRSTRCSTCSRSTSRSSLIGNSMGGFIGAELAIRYPQRIERLVLVAAAGLSVETIRTKRQEGLRHRAENIAFFNIGWLASRSPTITRRAALREAVLLLVVRAPRQAPPELTFELVKGSGKDGFNGALEALCNYPIRERLPEIECPTFIVWGDKDRLVPLKDASVFEELIDDSRKVIYKDTGHLTMLERPARFNADVLAFLREEPGEKQPESGERTFAT